MRTIIEMVSATRLDCVLGSAAIMRQACVTAVHYAAGRRTFGAPLISHPLMTSVLADLAAESEAATTLAMRLASAADQAARGDAEQAALLRIALPAAKFWVCKRAPMVAAEALECLGGNGYVEESDLPRLYREAPLNSVWEGSGNITALDVLRALSRSPAAGEALLAEAELAAGADPRLDAAIAALRDAVAGAAGAAGGGAGTAAGRPPSTRRAGWPVSSRWCCRPGCWPGTRRPRWPACSARPGSGRRLARRPAGWPGLRCRSAPCRTALTSRPSWTGSSPAQRADRLRPRGGRRRSRPARGRPRRCFPGERPALPARREALAGKAARIAASCEPASTAWDGRQTGG